MLAKFPGRWFSALLREMTRPTGQAIPEHECQNQRIDCVELEARVLYSASPIGIEQLEPVETHEELVHEIADIETAEVQWIEVAAEPFSLTPINEAFDELFVANPFLTDAAGDQPVHVVIIDSSVENHELLVADIQAHNPNTLVKLIDNQQNGIDQISEFLAGHSEIHSVHVVSHGADGKLQLGNSILSAESLAGYAGQIAAWRSSLSIDADILLYGCDLASNDAGIELIEAFGELTGADVAASDDLTGHDSLGGDWDLEYSFGEIDSEVAFSHDLQQAWQHVLVPPAISLPGGPVDYIIGESPTTIDTLVSLSDPDSPLFTGGHLIVSITSNGTGSDQLGIDPGSNFSIGGTDLRYSGVTIGFVFSDGSNGSDLHVDFNSSATRAMVEELLQNVQYSNSSGTPSTAARTVEFVVNDGSSDSNIETETINILDPVPQIDLDGDDSHATGFDFQTSFRPGGGPVRIVDLDFTYLDAGSPNWAELTVDISGNPADRPNEIIGYDLTGTGIALTSWNANDGRLRLGGDRPISEYLQVIQSLTYENTFVTDTTPRVIDIFVRDSDGNDSNVAESKVFIQQADGLWLTTLGGSTTGASGIGVFGQSDLIELGDPSLRFETTAPAGTTDGTMTSVRDFGLDMSLPASLTGLHFVSRDVEIGGFNSTKTLNYGDVLFTVEDTTFLNGVRIESTDVGLYDAATGTYSVLLDDLSGSQKLSAITLVEQSTQIGDVMVRAGSILFGQKAPDHLANDIWYFDPTGIGLGTTTGSPAVRLIEGSDIGIFNGTSYSGLELVENTMSLGGTTLQSGWILASLNKPTIGIGSGGLSVTEFDVFYIDASTVTMGGGSTVASAELLLEGSDLGLNEVAIEDISGLTFHFSQAAPIVASTFGNNKISGAIYEDVDGDGNVLDDNQLLSGVSVYLYDDSGSVTGEIDASDTWILSTTTDASGNYSFSGLDDGTYWVVVDSKTVAPSAGFNPTFGQGDVWAEQTYGTNGSVSYNGSYSYAVGPGVFYGGKQTEVSDDASSLASAEHVTRVGVYGSDKSNVDSGFSFNVITRTGDGDDDAGSNRTMQGSLRQFIRNANAIDNALHGVNTSRFAIQDSDSNHLYYQNDFIANSLSNVVATTLADASIGDFDPDYPFAQQHSWFRIDLDNSLSQLTVTDAINLDGYSQVGATENNLAIGQNANLRIELTNSAGDNKYGLRFDTGSNGSTLRGLTINDFGSIGVMVEYNVHDITIQGNFIGTDISGTLDIGNGGPGIQLRSNDNLVGGSNLADRNLISGNDNRGIALFSFGTLSGNVIENNYIGVDATGLVELQNQDYGIQLWNDNGTRVINNVISGNEKQGILFRNGSDTHDAVVQGNLIGVGADGTTIIANGAEGILINSDIATGNLIGGSGIGEGNIIAGNNGPGILFDGSGVESNFVFGNSIGTDASGILNLGNAGSGVLIVGDSSSNTIGGVAAGQANTIAFNGFDGVAIYGNPSDFNTIRGNSIYSNSQQGIDLVGMGGVNPNDIFDVDGGPNDLQNYPVLATAIVTGGDLTVSGTLNSRLNTNGYLIDFYWSPSGPGAEARNYIGSITVNTDSFGNANINKTFTASGVPAGAVLTATATDPAGSTSELAVHIPVTSPAAAPVIGNNQLSITEGQTVTISTGNLSATDLDDPDSGLIFSVSNVSGGQFELASAPNSAITSFTQAQLTANQIVFVDDQDENAPSYDVEVSDGSLTDGPHAATITFNNANDAPVITSDGGNSTANVNVLENTAAVTTVTSTDEDLPGDTLTYSITGGADQALFNLDASTGVLTFASAPDFETFTDTDSNGIYEVEITVDDGKGKTDVQSIFVTVTDDNEAPVITSHGGTVTAAVNVAENTTAVTTITATDQDLPGDPLTFTITGGPDATLFNIDSASGVLSFVSAHDFEAPNDADPDGIYEVEITVDDGKGKTDVQTIAATITDSNEAPLLLINQLTISEAQTLVLSSANLDATDVDNPDPNLIYQVSSINGGRFALASTPAVAITSFTASQITAGDIVFVDDGDEFGPSYKVSVTDGSLFDGPYSALVSFANTNDIPIGIDDQYTVNSGSTLNGSGLLTNDFDVDSPILTSVLDSPPANGTATVNPDGSFIYRPNPTFAGSDSFTYLVNDGTADSAPVKVVVEVLGIAISNNSDPDPDPKPIEPDPTPETIKIDPTDGGGTKEISGSKDNGRPAAIMQHRELMPLVFVSSDPQSIDVSSVRLAKFDFSVSDENVVFQSESSQDSSNIDEFRSNLLQNEFMDKAGWFWKTLNQNSERMATQASVAEVLLGGTAAIASSVTVGYLVWLIKGGQVLAAIMANLPAWQLIDPLPILNSMIDDDEDEDSLHKIISEGEREMETANV